MLEYRGYVLRINELRVLADAAMDVGRGLVSLKTMVNDVFATQICDVHDAVKRRAVLSEGEWCVSGMVQPLLVSAARGD